MSSTIAITGISSSLGRVVARHLLSKERVVGIDHRTWEEKPADLIIYPFDLRKKRCEEVFRNEKIDILVHVGSLHEPMGSEDHHSVNVLGAHNILETCAQQGVSKVVVMSSGIVYGPAPENSNFISEDAPLLAGSRFFEARGLIDVDLLSQSFFYKYSQIETVILRPVHIVGPTIYNAISNYLRLRRPWILLGFDPILQLIHSHDVARAVEKTLQPGVRGIYNLVGAGGLPISSILKELGKTPINVPHVAARPMLRALHKYKISEFVPAELDFLRYLCVLDGSRSERDWGWKPTHSLVDTILSVCSKDGT